MKVNTNQKRLLIGFIAIGILAYVFHVINPLSRNELIGVYAVLIGLLGFGLIMLKVQKKKRS